MDINFIFGFKFNRHTMILELVAERLFDKKGPDEYVSSLTVRIDGKMLKSCLQHTEADMLSYSEEKIVDCAAEYDKTYNRMIILKAIYKELFGEERVAH